MLETPQSPNQERESILDTLVRRVRSAMSSLPRMNGYNQYFTDGTDIFEKGRSSGALVNLRDGSPLSINIPNIGIVQVGPENQGGGTGDFFAIGEGGDLIPGLKISLDDAWPFMGDLNRKKNDTALCSSAILFRRLVTVVIEDRRYSFINGNDQEFPVDGQRTLRPYYGQLNPASVITFADREWMPVGGVQKTQWGDSKTYTTQRMWNDFYVQRPIGTLATPHFAYTVCGGHKFLILSVTTSGFARLKGEKGEIHVQLKKDGSLNQRNNRYFECNASNTTGWYDVETGEVIDAKSLPPQQ